MGIEEARTGWLQSSSVMLILSLMVFLSVLFERAREKLLDSTTTDMIPIINSLFGELTLLGFIGLTLFLVDKMKLVESLSEHVFEEEGYIGELCESVHMALFLVMLLFLGTVISVVIFAQSVVEQWKYFEETILDESLLSQEYNDMLNLTGQKWSSYLEPLTYRKAVYAAIRKRFLKHGHVEDLFDFSEYLSHLLGQTLSEVVEVPVSTWVGLEVFLLASWLLYNILSDRLLAFVLISFGYLIPISLRIVHMKVRAIKFDCAFISGFEQIVKFRSLEGEKSELLAGPSNFLHGAVESEDASRIGSSPFAFFFPPSAYDLHSLVRHYGRIAFDKRGHSKRFWFGEQLGKEAPDFIITITRYALLLNATYITAFLLIVFPALLKGSPTFLICFSVLALVPPIQVILLGPRIIKDLVLVSNIENMRNKRVLEHGVRRMKTRNAFLSLKLAYMMMNGVKSGLELGSPCCSNSSGNYLRQRAVWKAIFTMFDEDDSGDLTAHELTDLLMGASGNKITEAEIDAILRRLDSDQSGSIDFDEFFDFAVRVSAWSAESPKAISNGIFNLVDQGEARVLCDESESEGEGDEKEDEIDITELQQSLKLMKQELSADDVLSIIKDIDEDGNGKLNQEEFYALLRRLDVV